MQAVKFPYMMHCPKCKAKLKIKKPEMVGKRIPCPNCQKKIDVVTPDEDGLVPYGVTELPPPEPEPELTDEELDAIEEEERKQIRTKRMQTFKWWTSIVVLLSMLGGIGWGLWEYVFKNYEENAAIRAKQKDDGGDLFGKTFNVN
jgi:hypothetical protein